MKLKDISDTHIEFHRDDGDAFIEGLDFEGVDVLIAAGDICEHLQIPLVMPELCRRVPHVIYILGNHECYGSSIHNARAIAMEVDAQTENFHFLDNSSVTIDGQRFVGTTLWFRNDRLNRQYESSLNDFTHIRGGFREVVYQENEKAIAYLEDTVRADDVVVTHHLPSPKSSPWRFRGSNINRFFVCDMEPLIKRVQPKLWIHGHTHDSCDYAIGKTRVVCNPYGYVGYELNSEFDGGFLEV